MVCGGPALSAEPLVERAALAVASSGWYDQLQTILTVVSDQHTASLIYATIDLGCKGYVMPHNFSTISCSLTTTLNAGSLHLHCYQSHMHHSYSILCVSCNLLSIMYLCCIYANVFILMHVWIYELGEPSPWLGYLTQLCWAAPMQTRAPTPSPSFTTQTSKRVRSNHMPHTQ